MKLDLLPLAHHLRQRDHAGEVELWCKVRRCYLVATPEEWVRQALIQLLEDSGYPPSLMQVERRVGRTKDRLDLLVLSRQGSPFLLAEAKAPGLSLQPAVEQLARYNRSWRAPYVLAANGVDAICCQLDYATSSLTELAQLPTYPPVV